MSTPLVTIIIPTYNYAHLLVETLESVAAQTYTNWECLIVDDGSTDHTGVIVPNFIKQYKEYNFKYIKTDNAGTSAAKNAGLDKAKGELIQFLDADDLLSPDKLRLQVNLIQQQDCALVFSTSRFFTVVAGEKIEQKKYPAGFLATETLKGHDLLHRLIKNNIVTISSPLVKKSLIDNIGGFDTALRNNEDWILWFKIALQQALFQFDYDPLSYVNIRIHGASAMTGHHQMFLGEVVVRQQIDQLLQQQSVTLATKQLQQLNNDLLALHRVRSLEISKGFSYIITNFIKNPFSNYPLLKKGCFKLMVRFYKTVIKNETTTSMQSTNSKAHDRGSFITIKKQSSTNEN